MKNFSPLTREQIENLKVGDVLQYHINGVLTKPRKVVEIHARGVSIHGHAYVCFYQEFGEHSTISGSTSENESRYQLVKN